jgi:hypothetical protein
MVYTQIWSNLFRDDCHLNYIKNIWKKLSKTYVVSQIFHKLIYNNNPWHNLSPWLGCSPIEHGECFHFNVKNSHTSKILYNKWGYHTTHPLYFCMLYIWISPILQSQCHNDPICNGNLSRWSLRRGTIHLNSF